MSTFPSRSAAAKERGRLEVQLAGAPKQTVRTILQEYLREQVTAGRSKQATADDIHLRISILLRNYMDATPGTITVKRATELYGLAVHEPRKKTGVPLSAASHRYYLAVTKAFFRWAVKHKYASSNPFADVQPVGKVNRGKPQLRIEEARRFVTAALDLYKKKGDLMSLGALVALGCGLRASEVRLRRVRDLDDGGRILWITSGKTHNAQRNPLIPTFLRPYLIEASRGRPSEAFLFGDNKARPGAPRRRQAVNIAVARICKHAGVPQVCPHSLRGLWATLAVESGAATEAIASALGHGSFTMTARHYAQPVAIQNAKTARVMDVLGLGDVGVERTDSQDSADLSGPGEQNALAAELAKLDTATLRRLLRLARGNESFPNRSESRL